MKFSSKLFLPSVIFFIAVILSGCSGTSPQYDKYQNNLKNQIQDMTNVLNAGHYNEFMSNYVDPAYISSAGGVDAALLQFGNSRQQALYTALKAARNIEPLYDAKNNVMTYIATNLPKPIIFKLINGKWYLTSDWFK